MWEALGSAIKTFFEKDFVPSIIALATGIITVLLLPENNWMIVKLGQIWIGILAFALSFLIVKAVIAFVKFIQKQKIKRENSKYDDEQKQEDEKKMISDLWDSVDAMSPGDRQTLHIFLENNNTPIEESGNCFYDYNSLMSSDWIVSTLLPYEFENQENEQTVNENGIPFAHFINQGRKLYKLRDDIFQVLKYSKEKYGKISNFDE